MRRPWLFIALAMLAGCTAAPAATPTPAASVPDPVAIPVPSAIASGQSWWAWPGLSACGLAAEIRYDGRVFGLGDCAGVLLDPATTVRLHVGETLDLHTTTNAPVGTAPPELIIPLPSLATSDVLKVIAVADGGASASYLAVAPGTVTLVTRGFCLKGGDETNGPCPLLTVVVLGS